jgi:hypothetical protein
MLHQFDSANPWFICHVLSICQKFIFNLFVLSLQKDAHFTTTEYKMGFKAFTKEELGRDRARDIMAFVDKNVIEPIFGAGLERR